MVYGFAGERNDVREFWRGESRESDKMPELILRHALTDGVVELLGVMLVVERR